MIPAFINWSSGKDACFALWTLRQQGIYDIRYLFTTLNAGFQRVSMHGVREALLDEQARQLGIPLKKAYLQEHASMEDYNQLMQQQLEGMLQEEIRHAVFGDIFLEDLRQYRETQLSKIGMQGVFPIWKQNSRQLLQEIIAAGFKAIVVCANARYLDASFAGRIIDDQFLADLPPNVDPCGENGEFHTFVYDGPLFKAPVAFTPGETIARSYISDEEKAVNWDNQFYFKELLPLV
ncbi:diphthine--ammonia ligase [Chitinophaga agrisoli]|uniref:Diphthine--ammonia ligase n=1 Tax=Chitinophaga agrisoli TaxID=2607653 RepID=A0A5B2W2W7_9BACT|nr:diphthine--ammonia ligase [Chitinophaga agrisoli]KAA2244599.1 diphthine--ammonia ligase [Chitinophaga agrisoli]